MADHPVNNKASEIENGQEIAAQPIKPLGLLSLIRVSFVRRFAASLYMLLSLRGLYRFGRFFGTLEYLVNYKKRCKFARRLEHIRGKKSPTSERRVLTRDFFAQSRCNKLFYLIFERLAEENANALFSVTNREMVDACLKRGRGLYVAVSHHGAHHVAGLLFALQGYKLAAVREHGEGAMLRYMQARLDKKYPQMARTKWLYPDTYPREIMRLFRQGYVLGSAMDVSNVRRQHQKTEMVRVFGEERPFLSGPLRMAIRCKAPVIQCFIISEPNFKYRAEMLGPLVDPELIEDEEETVARAMQEYAANVERYVRKYPSSISRL